ncbi:hypothetical protein FP2506_00750 [Fulvimarina pelagi HTCC2506]|uniref:Uncharacterized protein n=1 Tax=Fulvimarina pelagi HTCC2506 TaxID=314231 RepID=Q0G2E7_9HYPH|nr:hypothetical protein FP2506_00750 [Fulvimarina pelagi HTCC2506]
MDARPAYATRRNETPRRISPPRRRHSCEKRWALSGRFARLGELLRDLALQQSGALGQFVLVRLQEKRVEAAAMLDRAQGMGRDLQAIALTERVGDQRDAAQVGQEAAAGLVVRVGHVVPGHDALAGEFADARHLGSPSL